MKVYFAAQRNTKNAITLYKIFGIHMATITGVEPLMANTVEICIKRIYEKLSARPNPR